MSLFFHCPYLQWSTTKVLSLFSVRKYWFELYKPTFVTRIEIIHGDHTALWTVSPGSRSFSFCHVSTIPVSTSTVWPGSWSFSFCHVSIADIPVSTSTVWSGSRSFSFYHLSIILVFTVRSGSRYFSFYHLPTIAVSTVTTVWSRSWSTVSHSCSNQVWTEWSRSRSWSRSTFSWSHFSSTPVYNVWPWSWSFPTILILFPFIFIPV